MNNVFIASNSSDASSVAVSVFVFFATFLALPIGLMIYFLYVLKKKEKKLQAELLQFASTRGFQFLAGDQGQMTDGGVFDKSGTIKNIISGELPQSKNSFRQYYEVEVRGSGKNKRVYHRTIMVADCPDTMSHFVLNSKLNTNQSEASAFGLFSNEQKIVLEGSFSEFYDVYSATGDERQLLMLLSPDVMEFILTRLIKYDIEILHGKLFIYAYPHINIAARGEMIDLFDMLVAEMNLKRNDVRNVLDVQTGTQFVVARSAENDGTRSQIKKSKLKATIIVAAFVPGVLVQVFKDKLSGAGGVIFWTIFFGAIFLLAVIGGIKQGRLKRKYNQYLSLLNKDKE